MKTCIYKTENELKLPSIVGLVMKGQEIRDGKNRDIIDSKIDEKSMEDIKQELIDTS